MLLTIAEKENVFTRMVEVSPKYIVCNMTRHKLYFAQAHIIQQGTKLDGSRHVLALKPQDRRPFHWSCSI